MTDLSPTFISLGYAESVEVGPVTTKHIEALGNYKTQTITIKRRGKEDVIISCLLRNNETNKEN